jgi:hypothetical protein
MFDHGRESVRRAEFWWNPHFSTSVNETGAESGDHWNSTNLNRPKGPQGI